MSRISRGRRALHERLRATRGRTTDVDSSPVPRAGSGRQKADVV
jgi:hypothetical protein